MRAPTVAAVAAGMSPLLRWTLAASLGVHLILLSLHFELPKLFKQSMSSPPLEVSLVNAKTLSKPSQADFLAQANLDGGGNTVVDEGSSTDAGLADAGIACTQCDCNSLDAGLPSCYSVGRSDCCFAVGPLPPPDLPAIA